MIDMRKIFNIITIALLAVSGFVSVSCEQMKSSSAEPVVRFVRPVDAAMKDKLLTEVSMGSMVAVIGEGLGDVCRIDFNDQTAKLNPAYVTPTSIIVTVPSSMPSEITNRMYLETKSGKKAEFGIAVMIPAPSVKSISCAYAPVGSDVTIGGQYFFAKDNGLVDVTFPGGLAAEVKSVTETQVVCTVPEGAVVEGPVSVVSKYGTGRSSFNWRSTEGLFENFTSTANVTWGTGRFASDNGCDGQYLHLYGNVGSWAWPANEMQLFWLNPDHSPLLTEGEPSDYALSFEYCCNKWDCTPMIMWFNSDKEEHNVDGEDAQCHWKLYEDGFDAGVWRTVTIPLTEFKWDKEEKTSERSIRSFDDMVNFHLMPFGAADGAGELDIMLDNFRLVKVK